MLKNDDIYVEIINEALYNILQKYKQFQQQEVEKQIHDLIFKDIIRKDNRT